MRIALLGLIFALALSPLAASAQSFTGVTPLTLTANPQYPHPYSTVSISPNSTTASLSSMTLSWTVNGKSVGKTTGTAPLMVQLGGPGSVTRVSVSTSAGFSASLTLAPSDIEIIAEPQTTVHPLYEGSPLVSPHSDVRFVALADVRSGGTHLSSSKLVYDWKLDDQQLQPQSGVGANTLTVAAPQAYQNSSLSVTVSDQAGTVYGQATYELSPVQPIVRLYANDPLKGPLYDVAIGTTYDMTDVEAGFVAVPYFFSTIPTISWTIGGRNSSQGPFVTVRSNGTGSGEAVVAARATAGPLETAGAQSAVSFKGTTTGGLLNLFGL